jgi:hypothetical protein
MSGTRTVQVFNRNQPPLLTFPSGTGPFNITEGQALQFNVFAQDLDANGIITSFTGTGLPSGATFTGNLNFKSFSWTPSFVQAGNYSVTFAANDNQGGVTTRVVQINVAEFGNHAPTITNVLPDTIQYFVGVLVSRVINAIDLDQDPIQLVMTQGPGAFVDSGNGKGVHFYEPDPTDLGLVFPVTFIATDSPAGTSDTLSTFYRVNNFLRGDVDGNYTYTMNDVVFLIRYLYRGGPAPVPISAGDADMNGLVNVADATYMINFLYRYGPRPPQ